MTCTEPPSSDIWLARAELGHLQMMCTEENELIFSDEVYMQLKFTPTPLCIVVVVIVVTVSCCAAIVIVHVQLWMNNNNNIT